MNPEDQVKVARVVMSAWQLLVLALRAGKGEGTADPQEYEKFASKIAERLSKEIADMARE